MVLGLVLAPFALIALISILLYVPPVQRFVVQRVASLLSRQLNMQLELEELHLTFPLDLQLEGLRIVKSPGDTLLALGALRLAPSISPLLHQQVQLPRLELERLRLHQQDSAGLSDLRVALREAALEDVYVDLSKQEVRFSKLFTSGGAISYASTDTTQSEPSEPLKWQIAAQRIELNDTELDIALPHDSLYLSGQIRQLALDRGDAALEVMRFRVGKAQLDAPLLRYAVDRQQPTSPQLDPQHIELRDASLQLRQLYSEGMKLDLYLQQMQLMERSGLQLRQLSGHYQMDSLGMKLEELLLLTQSSKIQGEAQLPWSLLKQDSLAPSSLRLDARLSTEDILALSGQALSQVEEETKLLGRMQGRKLLAPLGLSLDIGGTLSALEVKRADLSWPEVLQLKLEGKLYAVLDALHRSGKLSMEAHLGVKANALLALASPELARSYRLPKDLSLHAQTRIRRGDYLADLRLRDGAGLATLKAHYVEAAKRYKAQLHTEGLQLGHFMPQLGLGAMHLDVLAEGQGLDPLSAATSMKLTGRLHELHYAGYPLYDITLDTELKRGNLGLSLNSVNKGANLSLTLDGILSHRGINTGLALDLVDLDFQRLGLSTSPLAGELRLEGELRSDLKEEHKLMASIDGAQLILDGDTIAPPRLDFTLSTNAYSILGNLNSGDMSAQIQLAAGPTELQGQLTKLSEQALAQWRLIASGKSAQRQLEDLTPLLPQAHMTLTMGRDNPLRYYLAGQQIALGHLTTDLKTDPERGLAATIHVSDVRLDTLRLNELHLELDTEHTLRSAARDSLTLQLRASLNKAHFRTQEGFAVEAKAHTTLQGGGLNFSWRDERGALLHAAQLTGLWGGDAYELRLGQEKLRIAYRDFKVNPDNHLSLRKRDFFLLGSLRLEGRERGLIQLEAKDAPLGTQDAQLTIQQLHLEDFRALGLPDIAGTFFGDIHYQRQGGLAAQPTISGDLSLSGFRYEDKKLGHFTSSLFYEPRTDDSHYITADVAYNGKSALTVDGIYYPKQRVSPLTGTLQLHDFPLELANPFLLATGTSLQGTAGGSVQLAGTLTEPRLTGEFAFDKGMVHLANYGVHLQLDSIPVRLQGSTMHFDHYAIHPSVDPSKALYIDGTIEQSTSLQARAALRLSSDELTLLNEPRPKAEDQLLYGRIVASTNMQLTGLMTALRVRGALNVLSGTNCTYIMREDALETPEGKTDLVSFVDFGDTIFIKRVEPIEPALGGLDVKLSIHIDPSVRVGADLTSDGQDYAHVQGGGTLHFTYPPFGQMSLTGRYEMSGGGDLSYTLPVVGNKKFTIEPTSMLSWNGAVSNPYLNLSASQTVKATVNESGSNAQRVNFKISILIRDYVNRMNLSFGLSAPDNLSMQNSLATMSAEEQGKQAIALMATGVYLGSGSGAGKLDLNTALTSLLQSQINKTAGKLLQGTDLSLGMDRYDGSSGEAARTDYTYSFSRRFYNDRIRIIVGGKVQSGANASNQGQNFLDNVSLQYQLDKTGEQYFSLYHKRVTDNLLEGEYSETGLGYVLRRKLYSLWDVFRPRGRKQKPRAKVQQLFLAAPVLDSAAQAQDTIVTPSQHHSTPTDRIRLLRRR